jgi:hypothetical protein
MLQVKNIRQKDQGLKAVGGLRWEAKDMKDRNKGRLECWNIGRMGKSPRKLIQWAIICLSRTCFMKF